MPTEKPNADRKTVILKQLGKTLTRYRDVLIRLRELKPEPRSEDDLDPGLAKAIQDEKEYHRQKRAKEWNWWAVSLFVMLLFMLLLEQIY